MQMVYYICRSTAVIAQIQPARNRAYPSRWSGRLRFFGPLCESAGSRPDSHGLAILAAFKCLARAPQQGTAPHPGQGTASESLTSLGQRTGRTRRWGRRLAGGGLPRRPGPRPLSPV